MSHNLILVSACLAGVGCRYDGKRFPLPKILSIVTKGRAMVICPEQLGGLPTPRPPAQIVGGDGFDVLRGVAKVVSEDGTDVTDRFLLGAEETLRIARMTSVRKAIFKERSPSCGVNYICREKELIGGCGVTTALLLNEGIDVTSAEESDSVSSSVPDCNDIMK